MGKKYILGLIIIASCLQLSAQDKCIKNYTIATFVGIREDTRDSFPNNEHLDFLNYISQETEYPNYFYLGLSSHIVFIHNVEADVRFACMGGLRDIYIAADYFPFKNIGFDLGFYSNGYTLNQFSTYHKIEDVGMYGDLETNYRQSNPTDVGFFYGLNLRYDFWKIHSLLKLQVGASSIMPFSERVCQKEINGNYYRNIEYQTNYNFDSYLYPELEITIDCIKFNKSVLGLQLHTSYFYTKKSIDYTRTTYEWTAENPIKENVNGSKHEIKLFCLDFGLFLRINNE